jgi:hypothetical protein
VAAIAPVGALTAALPAAAAPAAAAPAAAALATRSPLHLRLQRVELLQQGPCLLLLPLPQLLQLLLQVIHVMLRNIC